MELLSQSQTEKHRFQLPLLIALLTLAAFCLAAVPALASPFPAAAADEQKLPEKWRKWLEEEVGYIISDRERDIFLKLETDEQREHFVEGFWEIRDPTPGTERNEMRDEHYQRLDYVNRHFGRDSTREGWRTDRGRMYIILGKPREVNPYSSGGAVYPLELWFYQADPSKGLPAFFYLIFYKRHGFGELVLYNPVADGPQALVPNAYSLEQAYETIRNINPELANASFNLLATESIASRNTPSLASLVLFAKIEDQKNNIVDVSYADRILIGEETITTEYSFNPDRLAHVISPALDERGGSMIAYAFELDPTQIDLGQYDDKIYGAYEVDLRLAEEGGTIIHTDKSSFDIEFNSGEFESRKFKSMMYEGNLLCPPGKYTFSLQLRNKLTKNYQTVTQTVDVPALPPKEAGAGNLVLAGSLTQLNPNETTVMRPFQFSGAKLSPRPARKFSADDSLLLFCQLFLPPERRNETPGEITLTYSFVTAGGEEVPISRSALPKRQISTLGVQNLMSRISLKDLSPGRYDLFLSIDFGTPSETIRRSTTFEITPARLPEPTVFSSDPVVPGSSAVRFSLGRMYENSGRKSEAENSYKAGLLSDPNNSEIRLALARLYMDSGKHQEALEALQPLSATQPDNPQMLHLTAEAYMGLERYSLAAKFLQRIVLAEEGVTTEVLNLLGEAYLKDGQLDKARDAWQRSLQADPDQPDIRKKLEDLDKG